MFYAKRLLNFSIFAFFIATLGGCATTTIYNAKLPSNIKTVEAAKKDLTIRLEKSIRIDYQFSPPITKKYAGEILRNLGKRMTDGIWNANDEGLLIKLWIAVYGIKALPDGIDIPFAPLYYEDLNGLSIKVSGSPPGIDLPNNVSLTDQNGNYERMQKIADDLYFIGQNIDKYNEEQLAIFIEKADRYRSLKIKPSMSEEQRMFLVQADQTNQMKNYFGAIKLYQKAIEVDPCSYPRAYSNLALLYAQVHEFTMAISYMKRYLLLEPGAKDARSAQDKIYGWQMMAHPPLNTITKVSTDPADAFVELNVSESGWRWNCIGRAPRDAYFWRPNPKYKFCLIRVSKPGYSTEEKSFLFESLPPEVHIRLHQSGSGQDSHGYLGISFSMVTDETAKSLGLPKQEGALVKKVAKDSPADRAGLQQGDIILTLDGKEINAMIDLPWILAATPIGKTIDFGIYRNGRKRTVKVSVGKLPD